MDKSIEKMLIIFLSTTKHYEKYSTDMKYKGFPQFSTKFDVDKIVEKY